MRSARWRPAALLAACLAPGGLPAVFGAAPGDSPPGRAASRFEQVASSEMGGQPRSARAGRYRVLVGRGEAGGPGLAGRLASVLVGYEAAYRAMWNGALGGPAGLGAAGPVPVYVLPGAASLRRVLRRYGAGRPAFEAGGAFLPEIGALAVAGGTRPERALVSNLVHEAAHLLNHELLGAGPVSPWFNEGLAQYCQYSAISDDGAILLGRIEKASALRLPAAGGEVVYRFVPRRSLSYLLGQFRRIPGLALGPLLRIEREEDFYGREAQLHYAQSWTLVHMLAEGRIRRLGRLRPHLFRYARREKDGLGGEEALLATLGISLEQLDDAWYRHIKKIW